MTMPASDTSVGSIVLELLDSASGVPLQKWSFPETQRIEIGRSDECDLVMANPYVSRTHACVERDAEGWQVVAISSQQLMIGGQRTQSSRLREGDGFRLGAQGCDLKFGEAHAQSKQVNWNQTMMFNPESCSISQLDNDQLQREVAEIENDHYFQNLSDTLQKLRQTRGPKSLKPKRSTKKRGRTITSQCCAASRSNIGKLLRPRS